MSVDLGAAQERSARVIGAYDESGAGVRTFRLTVAADFEFRPGMWVMLQFPDRAEKASAYSISSSPFERGYIEISLCKVGPLSERLFALSGGETLLLRGPFGKWVYDDEARNAALITDGTGLAPYRSMARYVLDKKLQNSLTIFHSARTPDLFFYEKDLTRFEESGIKVYRTITHPELMTPQQSWSGPRGVIDIGVLRREVADFPSSHFYLCGPKTLVESLDRDLLAAGIPQERIRYEKWGDYKWD